MVHLTHANTCRCFPSLSVCRIVRTNHWGSGKSHLNIFCGDRGVQVTLAGSGFNTLLAVYTGSTVNALTRVASNDNCAGGRDASTFSCLTARVVPGTVYSVQVDGQGYDWSQRGAVVITLNMYDAPSNDAFSAAVTTFPATGTTLGATLEPGEPEAVPGKGASGSVWYRFTAASNGVAKVFRYY